MSKGIFDKRFATHIPSDSAYHTLLCTNELGYVEADVNYKITGIPQESILFGYTTAAKAFATSCGKAGDETIVGENYVTSDKYEWGSL